jgi:hypothetical protein
VGLPHLTGLDLFFRSIARGSGVLARCATQARNILQIGHYNTDPRPDATGPARERPAQRGAREAERQLRRAGFALTGEPLARALDGPHVWTRQAALGIALRRGGWDAPIAALQLYDDDDSLREYADAALRAWLARKAPSAGIPSPEQSLRLRISLGRLALDPWQERLVRFSARL